MKKILSFALVLLALFALAVPVFGSEQVFISASFEGSGANRNIIITIKDAKGDHDITASWKPQDLYKRTFDVGPYIVYIELTNNGNGIDTKTITGHRHVYDDFITHPTCTEGGYTTYTCYICADFYTGNEVNALGHNWNTTAIAHKAPTCVEEGYNVFKCTRCEEADTRTIAIDPDAHQYDEGVVTNPTCEEDGFTKYSCTNGCGAVYTVDIPKLGHTGPLAKTPDPVPGTNGIYAWEFYCEREGCNYIEYQELADPIWYAAAENGMLSVQLNRNRSQYNNLADVLNVVWSRVYNVYEKLEVTRIEDDNDKAYIYFEPVEQTDTVQKIIFYVTFYNINGGHRAELTVPAKTVLVNKTTTKNDFASIAETSKNSRVWRLNFWVTETYSDGSINRVLCSVELSGNNANLSGKVDLGNGYTLVFDIKGNGSNIKDFEIIKN